MVEAWGIDLTRRELRRDGVPVPLGGRALEIIEVLARSAGELVTKAEIMHRVWPGAIVEESTLQVHISAIRNALGRDRGLLKTSFGRGYRLFGDWPIWREDVLAEPVVPQKIRSPVSAFSTNTPPVTTVLIGRDAVVQQLRGLVSAHRAVTLTGTGGIGKTVLAQKVTASMLSIFAGAAAFVDLSVLSDPDLVASAVAGVLGLKLGRDAISPRAVAQAIGEEKLLIVLDNCEHVSDEAARLTEALIGLCPATSILATSRESLRVDGERVYQVLPLEVPPEHQKNPANILRHSAVELFTARTQAQNSAFVADEKNILAIAAICRQVDGIPLAIEFAAARAATLGPHAVASLLRDRFDLLTIGRRTALPRHQTLRATLDWSYELLPETEQRLLCHLAVFSGGFTLDAARAVVSEANYPASRVAAEVANLVSKSLVTIDAASEDRWRLLETIRAYALEKLASFGGVEQAARRHAAFFRDLFGLDAIDARPRTGSRGLARYVDDIDNVRAALDWAFGPSGDPMTGVLLTATYVPVWKHLSLMAECFERAERALHTLMAMDKVEPHLRMRLQLALGMEEVYATADRNEAALRKLFESAEQLNDEDAQLRSLWAMWNEQNYSGNHRQSQILAERFRDVARRMGDRTEILIGDRLLGTTIHYLGDQPEARRHLERMLELYIAPSDGRHAVWYHHDQRIVTQIILARVLCLQGYPDQAKHLSQIVLDDALVRAHTLSLRYVLGWASFPIALLSGDFRAAAGFLALFTEVAATLPSFWKITGLALRGTLAIKCGEFVKDLALLREAFDTDVRPGRYIRMPDLLGTFAEGLAGLGQFAEALTAIDGALEQADRSGERWYVPELLRLRGEISLQDNSGRNIFVAERSFAAALKIARQQDALFWELRAAMSLARLRTRQKRLDDVGQILAPVYAKFNEGFGIADLQAAKAMLDRAGAHIDRELPCIPAPPAIAYERREACPTSSCD